MSAGQPHRLRVIVASPGDVQTERNVLPSVLEELNKGFAAEYDVWLDLYRWETDVYPGFHPEGPQGQVDSELHVEDCDIFICIFWKRFGTPTMDAQSGTEHEFQVAYRSWKQKRRPHIMVYFKQEAFMPSSKDEVEHLQRVIEFRENLPPEALSWHYAEASQFEGLIRKHLTQFIRSRSPISRPTITISLPDVLERLKTAYATHLTQHVSTIRIFGEAEPQPLEKVFVELSIARTQKRPASQAAWLGLMDSELRRRRNAFVEERESLWEDVEGGNEEKDAVMSPDELLRERTHAVLTGAPGCGKTTLLRYLALKMLREGRRFPVLLELKSISHQVFTETGEDLARLLFERGVVGVLELGERSERERFREFFLERLGSGQVAVFLDGLDEVRGERFFDVLCNAIRAFVNSTYGANSIVITTRPYALRMGFEGFVETEIAPLSVKQIQAFINRYYPDTPLASQLPQQLRRRPELAEITRVPLLLGIISELYRHWGEVIGTRLELYREVVNKLVVKLDKEKSVERFLVKDETGEYKRGLLKNLAYERLFVDKVGEDAERLIFTDEEILAKARRVCSPGINPDDLVLDVIATPLLREIGTSTYAFTHLTFQEYLAALALSEREDCERVFCRNLFDPAIASTEALPMVMGLVADPGGLYTALEHLPESLSFINLRLRARGLAYLQELDYRHLTLLGDQLYETIDSWSTDGSYDFADRVVRSLSGGGDKFTRPVVARLLPLLRHGDGDVRARTAQVLGWIGDESAVEDLCGLLNDRHWRVSWGVLWALGKIGGVRAVTALLRRVLVERDNPRRRDLASALTEGWVNGEPRAIEGIVELLRDDDSEVYWGPVHTVRYHGAQVAQEFLSALEEAGYDMLTETVLHLRRIAAGRKRAYRFSQFDTRDGRLRNYTERALGEGATPDVHRLLVALKNRNTQWPATEALGELGDRRAVDALMPLVFREARQVNWSAVEALGRIGDPRAVDLLLAALKDDGKVSPSLGKRTFNEKGEEEWITTAWRDDEDRFKAATALGRIGDASALEGLLAAIKDREKGVRQEATRALGKINDAHTVKGLLFALKDDDENVRRIAAASLENMSPRTFSNGLEISLSNKDAFVRRKAVQLVGYYRKEQQLLDRLLRIAQTDPDPEVKRAAADQQETFQRKLSYFAEIG